MLEKSCRKCRQIKPAEMFAKSARERDGLQQMCRACYSEYAANRLADKTPPKECLACKMMLRSVEFRRTPRVGLQNVCIKCEESFIQCPKCSVVKGHAGFSPDKSISTGRKSWCRECSNSHNRASRNSDEYRSKIRAYRSTPEIKERKNAYSRQYFSTDRGRDAIRRYANSPKGKAASARRRARERALEDTLTTQEWSGILAVHNNACAYCRRPFGAELKVTVDHRKPVSKGGPSTKENIVPACLRCNLSKGNREWPVTMPPQET